MSIQSFPASHARTVPGAARSSLRAAIPWLASLLLSTGLATDAHPSSLSLSLGTEFSYEGHLEQSGRPAEGLFDLSFELYDAPSGGEYLGRVDLFGVEVAEGRFVVDLDFGVNVFGERRIYLETHVRSVDAAEGTPASLYQRLAPRQTVGDQGSACIIEQDIFIEGRLTVDAPGSTDTDLTVGCCNDVDQGGQVQLGGFLNALAIDSNEIEGQGPNQPGHIRLNRDGGSVGVGVQEVFGPLTLPADPDVKVSSGGALQVGTTDGRNLALDSNEIMARNNGSTSRLELNEDGGRVYIGGDLDIGLELVQSSSALPRVVVNCPVGKEPIGGGCSTSTDYLTESFPTSTGWSCGFDDDEHFNTAYAICARVE